MVSRVATRKGPKEPLEGAYEEGAVGVKKKGWQEAIRREGGAWDEPAIHTVLRTSTCEL